MIKAGKICSQCRKPKRDDCERCKKPSFEGMSREHQDFYNSQRWRKLSRAMRRKHPLCQDCLELDIITASQMVDHVIEIRDGGDKWNPSNLRCLCNKCHAIKSGRKGGKTK